MGQGLWTVSSTLESLRAMGEKGIIGLETASGYWGLSSFVWQTNIILLVHCETVKNERWQCGHILQFSEEPVSLEECTDIGGGFYVTDPERTICDMIKYDCHEFHLIESVDTAYNWRSDVISVPKLEAMAKGYGVYDRLMELKEEAEEIGAED